MTFHCEPFSLWGDQNDSGNGVGSGMHDSLSRSIGSTMIQWRTRQVTIAQAVENSPIVLVELFISCNTHKSKVYRGRKTSGFLFSYPNYIFFSRCDGSFFHPPK
jgi:hypothetical protein